MAENGSFRISPCSVRAIQRTKEKSAPRSGGEAVHANCACVLRNGLAVSNPLSLFGAVTLNIRLCLGECRAQPESRNSNSDMTTF